MESGARSATPRESKPGKSERPRGSEHPKKSEAQIQQEILLYLGTRTDLRAWRSNAGAAIGQRGLIRFGLQGQADISGLMLPEGRRIEIEVKTDRGRQSEQQRKFQRMIEKHGGLYVVARSVEDVREGLQ